MSEPNYKAGEILSRELKRKREALNISFRKIEKLTGVSASTLSRIAAGKGKPDADVTLALCAWLEIPLDRVMNLEERLDAPVVYYPNESTPAIVEAHLRSDKNLTPEVAEYLIVLFRTAYEQFSNFEVKKGGKTNA
ncbi:MAG TPA: helix-turn-helix transcriptional regulator [Pyrinomonadaceae bacterium]|jgi:transcriptional regulator with XRE-family HTH domain|nr:helix-turn-helix transcriptional regulator [Pyrinomonadaceae bacterium]